MSFDHSVEGLAVDFQQARGRLLISARVRQHASHIAAFDLGERRPLLCCSRPLISLYISRLSALEIPYALGQVLNSNHSVTHRRRSHHRILKLADVSRPGIPFEQLQCFRRKPQDRKSTRLNSSHTEISYAVSCLKKKIN